MIKTALKNSEYKAIPPTTDSDYWQVNVLDKKTKVFTPINKELHRALLIEAKKRRPVSYQQAERKRYDEHYRRNL